MSLTQGTPMRPFPEEEALNNISKQFAIAKERLAPQGRRYIKSYTMLCKNSRGINEDHVLLLFNDVLLIGETAQVVRNPDHKYNVQYELMLGNGLKVSRDQTLLVLENPKENIAIVLEGPMNIAFQVHKALCEEMGIPFPDRNNGPRIRTVVSPTEALLRDARTPLAAVRPTPRLVNRDENEPDSGDNFKELQRQQAVINAQQKRVKRRAMREIAIENDDDDATFDQDNGPIEVVEDPNVDVVNVTVADYINGNMNGNDNRDEISTPHDESRVSNRIIAHIFGEAASHVIMSKHLLQFAGKTQFYDEEFNEKEYYRYIVFLDLFVIQKCDQVKYECFILADCVHEYDQRRHITLKWPHKLILIEMDPPKASKWFDRFSEAVMLAKAMQAERNDEEGRPVRDPFVIGNAVVRSGRQCYGRRQPNTVGIGSSEEEQKAAAILVQIQSTLGVTCDWLMNCRRRLILQGSLYAYGETGELEARRLIVFTDRMLITKPTTFKTHDKHTHDIVEEVELHGCRIHDDNEVIHIHTPYKRRRFLMAQSAEQALHWANELRNQVAVLADIARRIQNPSLASNQIQSVSSTTVYPLAAPLTDGDHRYQANEADHNLQQECDDDSGGSIPDNDLEDVNNAEIDVHHSNSPVETRLADFDDEDDDDEIEEEGMESFDTEDLLSEHEHRMMLASHTATETNQNTTMSDLFSSSSSSDEDDEGSTGSEDGQKASSDDGELASERGLPAKRHQSSFDSTPTKKRRLRLNLSRPEHMIVMDDIEDEEDDSVVYDLPNTDESPVSTAPSELGMQNIFVRSSNRSASERAFRKPYDPRNATTRAARVRERMEREQREVEAEARDEEVEEEEEEEEEDTDEIIAARIEADELLAKQRSLMEMFNLTEPPSRDQMELMQAQLDRVTDAQTREYKRLAAMKETSGRKRPLPRDRSSSDSRENENESAVAGIAGDWPSDLMEVNNVYMGDRPSSSSSKVPKVLSWKDQQHETAPTSNGTEGIEWDFGEEKENEVDEPEDEETAALIWSMLQKADDEASKAKKSNAESNGGEITGGTPSERGEKNGTSRPEQPNRSSTSEQTDMADREVTRMGMESVPVESAEESINELIKESEVKIGVGAQKADGNNEKADVKNVNGVETKTNGVEHVEKIKDHSDTIKDGFEDSKENGESEDREEIDVPLPDVEIDNESTNEGPSSVAVEEPIVLPEASKTSHSVAPAEDVLPMDNGTN